MDIKKVAVIGAGVMGAGIAAHIANAGYPVLLLDIVPKDATQPRNWLAESAVQKLLKAKPAAFMHPKFAKNVTVGNLEDDLEQLKDVDWIVEAVLEDPVVKSALYKKVDASRKKGSVISSNTSTIPLEILLKDQSAGFATDFLITHFFNPPRYMQLLEVVVGPKTRKDALETVVAFADQKLGKGIVYCKDSPAFIANRIGVFWIQAAMNGALDLDLSIDEADLVMSKPIGVPKTGVFGLSDLVGLDLMPHLTKSLKANLPKNDAYQTLYRDMPLLEKMIKEGYTGRKGKGGFYRLERKADGKSVKESVNLKTGAYAESKKPRFESVDLGKKGLKAVVSHEDKGGQYAWYVLSRLFSYVASLVGVIADDIHAIDRAMQMGYNWKTGPFGLMDQMGVAYLVERLTKDGLAVPDILRKAAAAEGFYRVKDGFKEYLDVSGAYKRLKRPEGVLLLEDIKLNAKPVLKNASASTWDIGDGVLCVEFTSKMNSIDSDIMELLSKTSALIQSDQKYKAMVIYNEGQNFSVGVNLGYALFALNIGLWQQVESIVTQGQQVYNMLKYAPFPVVGAPQGMALGGGCEVLLHCSAITAHAESYIGLVEVGVGLIPGWGGCKEMVLRWSKDKKTPKGPMPAVMKAFEQISTAKVSTSAQEALDLKFFLEGRDQIVMNKDRLLMAAKTKALELAKDYKAPQPAMIRLPGESGKVALKMAVDGFKALGMVTPHDEVVADHLASVLTGESKDHTQETSEEEIMKLELKHFLQLVRTNATVERVEHMLETGKPLRN